MLSRSTVGIEYNTVLVPVLPDFPFKKPGHKPAKERGTNRQKVRVPTAVGTNDILVILCLCRKKSPLRPFLIRKISLQKQFLNTDLSFVFVITRLIVNNDKNQQNTQSN